MNADTTASPLSFTAQPQGFGRGAQETDAQLQWVFAAQSGDTSAFNRLVLLWQERIFNLALRTLGDVEEAAEATQETFFSAFKNVRRFRLQSRFSTWLYSIAANECRTRMRRQAVRKHDSLDAEDPRGWDQRLSADEDREAELDRNARQLRVRRALLAELGLAKILLTGPDPPKTRSRDSVFPCRYFSL